MGAGMERREAFIGRPRLALRWVGLFGATALAGGCLSGLGGLSTPAGATPSCSASPPVTCTFAFAGALDSVVVPAGASSATIVASGAGGGGGNGTGSNGKPGG